MNPMQTQVATFMRAVGQEINTSPGLPEHATRRLRHTLIGEESAELLSALSPPNGSPESVAEIAKELCDLLYVAFGTAVSYGIDLDPIFTIVHESNMQKLEGPIRADGKRMKPDGWEHPVVLINRELFEQQARGLIRE